MPPACRDRRQRAELVWSGQQLRTATPSPSYSRLRSLSSPLCLPCPLPIPVPVPRRSCCPPWSRLRRCRRSSRPARRWGRDGRASDAYQFDLQACHTRVGRMEGVLWRHARGAGAARVLRFCVTAALSARVILRDAFRDAWMLPAWAARFVRTGFSAALEVAVVNGNRLTLHALHALPTCRRYLRPSSSCGSSSSSRHVRAEAVAGREASAATQVPGPTPAAAGGRCSGACKRGRTPWPGGRGRK